MLFNLILVFLRLYYTLTCIIYICFFLPLLVLNVLLNVLFFISTDIVFFNKRLYLSEFDYKDNVYFMYILTP